MNSNWKLYSSFVSILQIKSESAPVNQMHMNDTNSDDDSFSDDDSPKRRRDLLTRRPSYHRILKDITGPDIAGNYKCTRSIFFYLCFASVQFGLSMPFNGVRDSRGFFLNYFVNCSVANIRFTVIARRRWFAFWWRRNNSAICHTKSRRTVFCTW